MDHYSDTRQKSAGAVIYYEDCGKRFFLLLKYPTYWGFAKGWIEASETEEEAAIREVREETGLSVKFIPGFRYEQKWFFRFQGKDIRKEAAYFLARVSSKEAAGVKISEEHQDFKWLELDSCLKAMRVKANKEMIKHASEFIAQYEKQKKLF